jgi:hypothetical protein
MDRCHFLLIILLSGMSLPACLPRDRLSLNCEWIERDRQALHLRNNSHRQHLNHDLDIAIEVIMRSADAEHGRRYGYSAHGGYVDGGRFRDACREKVFAAIAEAHGLTIEQVRNASARVRRNWRFVLPVSLPFMALYYFGALMLCRIWSARFSANEQYLRFVALAITSIVASVAGVQLAVLWFNIAEMLRVGNDHLGQTRAFPTASPYLAVMFFTGLILFWFAGLRQYRRGSPTPIPTDAHLLRLNS